jgi:hypothetical protein
MAATNFTPISLYYSTTAAAAPTSGNLVNGELGLNITDGKLYYKDNSGVVQLLASKAALTSVDSISFGTTGLTPNTATTGAITVAGTLAVGSGGTGLTSGTSGGLLYYSATGTLASSALLTQYGIIYGGGAGAAPVATAAGTTGQILSAVTGGAPIWSSTYAGTVTSVSFTGGIITVATQTTTPAFTIAGTSGGIPYFSSGTTWATSAALAASAIVLGGGAGVAPATTTTGTGVVTAIGNAVNTTGGLTTIDGTATLTNKRINPRVSSTTSTATLTPDISANDQYNLTAQAVGLTVAAPTGTPVDGNKLIIRILDNGTSQTISWNATYTVIGTVLPTATTISKMLYVGCIYNAANTRWDVVAVTTQA